jgi:hypothetical protein
MTAIYAFGPFRLDVAAGILFRVSGHIGWMVPACPPPVHVALGVDLKHAGYG